MSNAQHLSSTGEWYSPESEVELGRKALGGNIYIDPCSSEKANKVVRANYYFTHKDQSLSRPWFPAPNLTAWINPPGTCPRDVLGFTICKNAKGCSCKLPVTFLRKTIEECSRTKSAAVFLAYSVNMLRHLSVLALPLGLKCTISVPPKRIQYLNAETMEPVKSTNCDSIYFYFTTKSNSLFKSVFDKAGHSIYERW